MSPKRCPLEKPKINMTPMIDVVFLLLAFFVLTFKIIVPEGDFNVQTAPAGRAQPAEITVDSVLVRLMADTEGLLSAIQLNGENVENFDLLRQLVSEISLTKPGLEVVLFPDDHLRYDDVVKAFTAVNGELREGKIRKICDNIKFQREPSKIPLNN